ncbi:unnamed protein product [Didymodactylos carnosus]|uniref:Uncharacterized protein n=1 Tax=Didymodactylos carnosus TaxID=1234261 RepID=A0A813NXL7_9BILA|nr:unnamed protein product [Didymodactylos carnosus]CAF0751456.1 unnamed protein product [Didymodactylos carnosus]CAF3524778.1 unnamed protein product [Didymodactylos carnosus]CAF3530264.1 unnamed protein product [Didymodactylos carnosus]
MVRNYHGGQCDGNRTIRWDQFCDGIYDCLNKYDEEGPFCRQCVNNLYSCPPEDDIRCDLACKVVGYIPCQSIQNRRVCSSILQGYDNHHSNFTPYLLLKDFNFYVAVGIATIVFLIIIIATTWFIRYLIRTNKNIRPCFLNFSKNSSNTTTSQYISDCQQNFSSNQDESSHSYEQSYEPPPYYTAHKYPETEIRLENQSPQQKIYRTVREIYEHSL